MALTPDFIITKQGTVWQFKADSEAAKKYSARKFDVDNWQGSSELFTVEVRLARQLADKLIEEGFRVA